MSTDYKYLKKKKRKKEIREARNWSSTQKKPWNPKNLEC